MKKFDIDLINNFCLYHKNLIQSLRQRFFRLEEIRLKIKDLNKQKRRFIKWFNKNRDRNQIIWRVINYDDKISRYNYNIQKLSIKKDEVLFRFIKKCIEIDESRILNTNRISLEYWYDKLNNKLNFIVISIDWKRLFCYHIYDFDNKIKDLITSLLTNN